MRYAGLLLLWAGTVAGAVPLTEDPWPRAVFFRGSEGAARGGRTPFDDWLAAFGRLSGIIGKCLDEEIPNTAASNIGYFSRYKAAYPSHLVLLHYNGNARDPRNAAGFYPGHFLYRPGEPLTAAVSAAATVLPVADARSYQLKVGREDGRPEELLLAELRDGRLDFVTAEHVVLEAVDLAAKTITVRRGQFGTATRDFPAGAVVEHHVTEGPWGKPNNLLWHYNWATTCPRDPAGRTAADVFVSEFAALLGPGGRLAACDGVEFDVLGWSKTGCDTDGDHRVDDGLREGRNVYGLGVYDLCRRLRAARPEKLWLADGHSAHHQRAVAALNGIESEGWPDLHDKDAVDWSAGLNRHRYWTQFAAPPRLSYFNHKQIEPGVPGVERNLQVPLSQTRLVLAAALLTDSTFTAAMAAPRQSDGQAGVFDELVAGMAQERGWLGQASGPAVSLAARTPNLLAGHPWPTQLAGGRLQQQEGRLTITPEPGADLQVTLANLDLPAGDATLQVALRSGPPAGFPADVPRLVELALRPAGDLLAARRTVGWTDPAGQDRPLDARTGAFLRPVGLVALQDERHRALFVHPPYQGTSGQTWWETTIDLPPRATLRGWTGLRQAPSRSDGVGCRVHVRLADGPAKLVWERHHQGYAWQPWEVDLSAWSGQRVTLRGSVDAGPAGQPTADQAYWGDLQVVAADRPPRPRGPFTPGEVMSWAGDQWFAAGAYFRDLGPNRVELTVTAEGDGPLELRDLALYAAPDAWFRRYERGAVLANPSLQPVVFDLAQLAPGARFRRFQGRPEQDPGHNNGQLVEAAVSVAARDALFLRWEK
ncbi:MAG: hypothetical protein IT204_05960 [Fimbriimonadaceae bacterium]|nr:hypothetical protein [Fimbriimonadaceae bacterium]